MDTSFAYKVYVAKNGEDMSWVSLHRTFEGALAKITGLNPKMEHYTTMRYGGETCIYYSDFNRTMYVIIETALEA